MKRGELILWLDAENSNVKGIRNRIDDLLRRPDGLSVPDNIARAIIGVRNLLNDATEKFLEAQRLTNFREEWDHAGKKTE